MKNKRDMRHRLDLRKIRKRWDYSVKEVSDTLSVHIGTVQRWIRHDGLKPVEGTQHPYYIRGSVLLEFLAERLKQRRSPEARRVLLCEMQGGPKGKARMRGDHKNWKAIAGWQTPRKDNRYLRSVRQQDKSLVLLHVRSTNARYMLTASHSTMFTKTHMKTSYSENIKIKRKYFEWRAESDAGSAPSTINQIVMSIGFWEEFTNNRDFRQLDVEAVKAFKKMLRERINPTTGQPLSGGWVYPLAQHFFECLDGLHRAGENDDCW